MSQPEIYYPHGHREFIFAQLSEAGGKLAGKQAGPDERLVVIGLRSEDPSYALQCKLLKFSSDRQFTQGPLPADLKVQHGDSGTQSQVTFKVKAADYENASDVLDALEQFMKPGTDKPFTQQIMPKENSSSLLHYVRPATSVTSVAYIR